MAVRLDNPVAATLLGVLDRVRMRATLPPLADDERLDGKTALVTGAASGLGFATSVDLARRGARVIMADLRDPAAAVARAQRLVAGVGATGPIALEPLLVDLADLADVRRAVASLEARRERVDVLVSNAAVVPGEARRTPQGLDEMFVVNYLASFALVRRLLDARVVDPRGAPRIVFVSSEAHRWSRDRSFEDVRDRKDPARARALGYYGEQKMLLTTFAWELARRLAAEGGDAGVFALCPGAMRTNIAREAPLAARAIVGAMMRVFFQDPFGADEPVVWLACSRAMRGQTAVYLHKMTRKEPDPRATDSDRGRALWDRSEALVARFA
jgi:NAD(P)-dependent dehydrogenase (short-subunit alcohol dehydrogenase family)